MVACLFHFFFFFVSLFFPRHGELLMRMRTTLCASVADMSHMLQGGTAKLCNLDYCTVFLKSNQTTCASLDTCRTPSREPLCRYQSGGVACNDLVCTDIFIEYVWFFECLSYNQQAGCLVEDRFRAFKSRGRELHGITCGAA
jgi:hypothetical protein